MEQNVQTTEATTGDTNVAEHVDTTGGVPESKDIELQLGKDKVGPNEGDSGDKTLETQSDSEKEVGPNDEQKTEEKADDKPTLYVVPDLPEGITIADEARDALFETAKKHGLEQDALNDLFGEHIKAVEAGKDAEAESVLKQWDDTQKQWGEELSKEWGADKEKYLILMNKAVTRFTQDNPTAVEFVFGKAEEGKTLNPNPAVAKMFLEIAKVMSPDTLETGQLQSKQKSTLDFSDLNQTYKTT